VATLMFPTQRILLCFLSNEDVATTMREAQSVEEYDERQSVEEYDQRQSVEDSQRIRRVNKLPSQSRSTSDKEVSQQPAFEARGHLKTSLRQDIRGSESTARNDCNTD
jgi:Ni/Co efflux regulator RcnB